MLWLRCGLCIDVSVIFVSFVATYFIVRNGLFASVLRVHSSYLFSVPCLVETKYFNTMFLFFSKTNASDYFALLISDPDPGIRLVRDHAYENCLR